MRRAVLALGFLAFSGCSPPNYCDGWRRMTPDVKRAAMIENATNLAGSRRQLLCLLQRVDGLMAMADDRCDQHVDWSKLAMAADLRAFRRRECPDL